MQFGICLIRHEGQPYLFFVIFHHNK